MRSSERTDFQIVIIGAGAAGLAAASELVRSGRDVHILEATGRAGGRIYTVHDPLSPVAIELGAEFIHGRPPEIWDLIRSGGLLAYEHSSEAVHVDQGRIKRAEIGEKADEVLAALGRSHRKRDESFEQYLRRSHQSPEAKKWARIQVEGFNAADKDVIGTASLTQDAEAAERIEGDRMFRLPGGYDSIALELLRSIHGHATLIRFHSVVERVIWRRGEVEVNYRSAIDGRRNALHCRQLLVTVPLGVLQATPPSPGAIEFNPPPGGVLSAAQSLRFGQVYRITFRFQETFWQEQESFKGIGFVVSTETRFPTWWTANPVVAPILTAWMAGSAADQNGSLSTALVVSEALDSLARILKQKVPAPQAAYFHDWRTDPFFRGAYSYVPVGALPARQVLSRPIAGTLFFAGEAADLNGEGGTVHGAIASGRHAAHLILGGETHSAQRRSHG